MTGQVRFEEIDVGLESLIIIMDFFGFVFGSATMYALWFHFKFYKGFHQGLMLMNATCLFLFVCCRFFAWPFFVTPMSDTATFYSCHVKKFLEFIFGSLGAVFNAGLLLCFLLMNYAASTRTQTKFYLIPWFIVVQGLVSVGLTIPGFMNLNDFLVTRAYCSRAADRGPELVLLRVSGQIIPALEAALFFVLAKTCFRFTDTFSTRSYDTDLNLLHIFIQYHRLYFWLSISFFVSNLTTFIITADGAFGHVFLKSAIAEQLLLRMASLQNVSDAIILYLFVFRRLSLDHDVVETLNSTIRSKSDAESLHASSATTDWSQHNSEHECFKM